MKRVYLETYGCQMNVADSELILGLLGASGYQQADSPEGADLLLVHPLLGVLARDVEPVGRALLAGPGHPDRR